MVSKARSLYLLHIEKKFKEKNIPYEEKATLLLVAWRHADLSFRGSCIDCDILEHIINTIYLMTLPVILNGEWCKIASSFSCDLRVIIKRCAPYTSKVDASWSRKLDVLLNILDKPWSNPIIRKILEETPVSDEEVVKFLLYEGFDVFILRLEMLCENKCEELALLLVKTGIKYLHHFHNEGNKNKYKPQSSYEEGLALLQDIYLSLLYINKKWPTLAAEVKRMTLGESLLLVRRHSRRTKREEWVFKQNEKVCEVIVHTILTTAMIQIIDEEEKQALLYELIKEWINMIEKKGASISDLNVLVQKLSQTAGTSLHVYMFCKVLKSYDVRYRSIKVELFIRGLTLNMNEIEHYKALSDEDNVRMAEISLSLGLLELADQLKDKPMICRECILTAFSVNPTRYSFDLVKDLAFLTGKCKDNEINYNRPKRESSYSTKKESLRHLMKPEESLNPVSFYRSLSTHSSQLDEVSPIDVFDSEHLDLAPTICDDLLTVLNGPRNLTLNWSTEWSLLKAKCLEYMQAFNNKHSLNHVGVDLDSSDTCNTEPNNNTIISEHCIKEKEFHDHPIKSKRKFDLNGKAKSGNKIPTVNSSFFRKDLSGYLANMNLNPIVILKRPTVSDLIKNHINCDNATEKILKLHDSTSCSRKTESNILLAQSIPGLNSLEMIIPETQESTVQVVQVSNCTNVVNQSPESNNCHSNSTSDHVSKTSVSTQSSSFEPSENVHETASSSESYISLTNLLQTPSQCQSKEKIWAQVIAKNSSDTQTGDSSDEPSSSDNMILSSNPTVRVVSSSTCSTSLKNSPEDNVKETSILVSDEPSKIRKDLPDDKKSDNCIKFVKCDFESKESVDSKTFKPKNPAFIVKSTTCRKEELKVVGSTPAFRLIVRDKRQDQSAPNDVKTVSLSNEGNKTELFKSSSQGVMNYSNSEQLLKFLCKKDSRIQENVKIASLPKFQHAFGRQTYQLQTEGNDNVSVRNTNNLEVSHESTKESVHLTTGLSKGIQTVSKEFEETGKSVASESLSFSPTASCSTLTTATQSNKSSDSPKTDVASSSGVIFTYKIPGANKSVVQLKSATVLKKSLDVSTIKTPQKIEINPQPNKSKDNVVRNNMNVLLAAALRPVSSGTIISNSTITPKTLHKEKLAISKKTIKRPASSSAAPMKSLNETTIVSSICQTDSTSVVPMNVPLRTVQVINEISPNLSSSSTDIESRKMSVSRSPVEQVAVSSTTLEQLREFESVLERVTNTSQMKEKSSIKETSLEDPEESKSQSCTEVSDLNTKSESFISGSADESTNPPSSVAFSRTNSASQSSSLISSTKLSGPTPVVVVQSCSRPVVSPALSVSSQGPISPVQSSSSGQSKVNPKLNKSKTKAVSKTSSPTSTLKVSNLPKPQQKPQEDEQTTQRIYAILDKYAEQLRNSPELKNKPAPRRRSNPPTNPSHSTKRKKSSHSKPKSSVNLPSANLELSPTSEDIQTLGSEDSSNGVSQISQALNSPQNNEELSSASLGDFASDGMESDKEPHSQHQIVLTEPIQNPGRAVIVQENIHSSVINVDSAKLIAGKQVVVGSGGTVPLTLSLPPGGSVKQVIFPVPTDGRHLMVAKVPKMYRVHQVTMPSCSPLLTASSAGTVVLRQMCLNKSNSTLKPVKVPVVSALSSGNLTNQSTVVLPSGSQTFPLSANSNFGETFGVTLDNSVMLNSHSSVNFVTGKKIGKLSQESTGASLLCTVSSSNNESHSENPSVQDKSSSVIVSSQDTVSKISTSSGTDKTTETIPLLAAKGCIENTITQKSSADNRSHKIWSQVVTLEKKDTSDLISKPCVGNLTEQSCTTSTISFSKISEQKGVGKSWTDEIKISKDSFTVICSNESVIKNVYNESSSTSNIKNNESWCSGIKTEYSNKSLNSETITRDSCQESSDLFSNARGIKRKSSESPTFHLTYKKNDKLKAVGSKHDESVHSRLICNFEKELRLQKSLSEECEDLGVDKPSTSDLFPEAELILEPDTLSRDSIAGESFSRMESSPSSFDSSSRSPEFGGKLNSSWLKQKKTGTKKRHSIGLSYDQNYSRQKSRLDSPLHKNHSCVISSDGNDKKFINDEFSQLDSKPLKLPDTKSVISDAFSDDICEFSELEDNCESVACSDGDSDSNAEKKSTKMYSDELVKRSDLDEKFSECCDAVDGELELKESSVASSLNTDSFQETISGRSLEWYHIKKTQPNDSPTDSNFNTESEVSLQDGGNIGDSDVSIFDTQQENGFDDDTDIISSKSDIPDLSNPHLVQKRKSTSPYRSGANSKTKKSKKFIQILDSSDDSRSSIETGLLESSPCDQGHRVTRRSSSRGLIKKGCPCLNNSSESHMKKKKDKESPLKAEKMSTCNSFSATSGKKHVNLKSPKAVIKKR